MRPDAKKQEEGSPGNKSVFPVSAAGKASAEPGLSGGVGVRRVVQKLCRPRKRYTPTPAIAKIMSNNAKWRKGKLFT